jgi:hypothetical protein
VTVAALEFATECDVDLFDCSIVCYPAYLDTNVAPGMAYDVSSMNSIPDRVLVEARSFRAAHKITIALVDDADRDWIRREKARKTAALVADDYKYGRL